MTLITFLVIISISEMGKMVMTATMTTSYVVVLGLVGLHLNFISNVIF